jgi:hypothetical protein
MVGHALTHIAVSTHSLIGTSLHDLALAIQHLISTVI